MWEKFEDTYNILTPQDSYSCLWGSDKPEVSEDVQRLS